MAGHLGRQLLPDVFGELPPEVLQAIGEHDLGWATSDEAQMNALSQERPRPFPDLSVEKTLPSWQESIAHARSVSPLVEVMVSRHFCLLAHPAHPGSSGAPQVTLSSNDESFVLSSPVFHAGASFALPVRA